ncbi:MAG: hypothetical protein ABIH23_23895 [bacterium]
MTKESNRPRFLRDKESENLYSDAKGLLLQAEQILDIAFSQAHDCAIKRLDHGVRVLSDIETAIDILRNIDPPPNEAIDLLVAAAKQIQLDQREFRDSLVVLLGSEPR